MPVDRKEFSKMSFIKRLSVILGITMGVVFLFTILTLSVFGAGSSESESNDTVSTANAVSLNSSISGNISKSSDVDWYKITIPQAGYFNVEFSHELVSSSSSYWNFYVYDETGVNRIDGEDESYPVPGNSNVTTPNYGVPAGTYYIKIVKGTSIHSDAEYNVRVNFTASSSWETENNGSKNTADTIPLHQTITGALTDNTDADWYKITIPQTGYFNVEFSHELVSSSSSYWTFYVYDETGVNRITGENEYYPVPGNSNVTTPNYGVLAGTYYIKIVKGTSIHSDADYSVRVNFTASTSWETENNGSKDLADSIPLNQTISGVLTLNSDADWYKITIPQAGHFHVEFDHALNSSSSSHWNLYVYDNTGVNRIDGTGEYYPVAGNANLKTPSFGVPAGTYYVKVVKGTSIYVETEYRITVRFTASSAWETENNSSMSEANSIALYQKINGAVSGTKDADWFKVQISSAGKIAISFQHTQISSTSSCWEVFLYDSTGTNKLQSFTSKGNVGSTTGNYADVSAGTYYIKIVKGNSLSYVDYEMQVVKEHEHTGSWTQVTAPTCTTAGSDKKVCSICGEVEYREKAALGHNYVFDHFSWSGHTATAECVCSRDPKHHESYTATVTETVTKTPTCENMGTVSYTARYSSYTDTKTETLVALGHDYSNEWTVDVKATCTTVGSKSRHCSRCDSRIEITEIPMSGEHKFGEWQIVKEPSCTEKGSSKRVCSSCGQEETETIEALGHDYSDQWTVDKLPTCTEPGSQSHHCTRCDSKTDVTAIEPSHVLSEWVITKEPTCTEPGESRQTCANCNYVNRQTIEALGHDYASEWTVDKEPTCLEPGSQSHHCNRCDSKTDVTEIPMISDHVSSDWIVDKAPEIGVKGKMHKECIHCHVILEETELPALPDGSKKSGCGSIVGGVWIVFLASLAGVMFKKKH